MPRIDLTTRIALLAIAFFLGMIAVRPLLQPDITVQAQGAKFDHVFIVAGSYLYNGRQGILVMDKRNGNVWFIPKRDKGFDDPVFVIRMQWEKLDQSPQ